MEKLDQTVKWAADPALFAIELGYFYEDLAPLVAETMLIPIELAATYCTGHQKALAANPSLITPATTASFEESETIALAEIALLHKSA